MGTMASFMDRVRNAGKSVADAGAKQLLKTDLMFLDREINTRKQAFGIDIYDLMEELEGADGMSEQEKEAKIRASFDNARKDIAIIEAKKECKLEEMAVLDATSNVGAPPPAPIPPADGIVLSNSHPQDSAQT